jgi:hypothetical protein
MSIASYRKGTAELADDTVSVPYDPCQIFRSLPRDVPFCTRGDAGGWAFLCQEGKLL